MGFMFGEVQVTNPEDFLSSVAIRDLAVIPDGDLTVKVETGWYELNGVITKYQGSVGNAVVDNAINYVYINSSGNLTINTTGYPGSGSYIRLARVVTQAGFILGQAKLERVLFTSGSTPIPPTSSTVYNFGNSGVSSTTTARYLTPGFGDTTAQTSPIQFESPIGGTARNLRVRHNALAGNGQNIVYTVRINNVASALVVTLGSTATSGSDLTHTVALSPGDLIDILVTKAGTIVQSPGNVTAVIEVTP